MLFRSAADVAAGDDADGSNDDEVADEDDPVDDVKLKTHVVECMVSRDGDGRRRLRVAGEVFLLSPKRCEAGEIAECCIGGYERCTFEDGLRGEHAIEGILVAAIPETPHFHRMPDVDWESSSPQSPDEIVEQVRWRAVMPDHLLAYARLDRDLPSGCGAHQELVLV